MRTTTSGYFKAISELGLTGAASYSDCNLSEVTSSDRQQGQGEVKYGGCTLETDSSTYYYFVALSPTATFLYGSMDEVKK